MVKLTVLNKDDLIWSCLHILLFIVLYFRLSYRNFSKGSKIRKNADLLAILEKIMDKTAKICKKRAL